ncbi:MAG: DUF4230 domain-containing protein [Pseudomonadota bacterium]
MILSLALGALGTWVWLRPVPVQHPDPAAVVERVREVMRLETLEVSLYKKITFSPEPEAGDSTWSDVVTWIRHAVSEPRGRAIVFATLRLSFDLGRLDARALQVRGDVVEVVLPPLEARVEILPDETEVLGSNLDSAQTARLFELARQAFMREAGQDPRLRQRARQSAERSLRALLLGLGFRELRLVDQLTPVTGV